MGSTVIRAAVISVLFVLFDNFAMTGLFLFCCFDPSMCAVFMSVWVIFICNFSLMALTTTSVEFSEWFSLYNAESLIIMVSLPSYWATSSSWSSSLLILF